MLEATKMGKGIEVGKVPDDMAEELEGYTDKRQYPFIKRTGEGEFAVMVHSKPFGKAPLSEEEKEEREKAAEAKKEASRKRRLDAAEAKLKAANEKVKELEED